MPDRPRIAILLSQRKLIRDLLGELLQRSTRGRAALQLTHAQWPVGSLPAANLLIYDDHGIPPADFEAFLEELRVTQPDLRQIHVDETRGAVVLDEIASAVRIARGNEPLPQEILTPLEIEVLIAVASGLRNSEIAQRMRRSSKTVEKHRANAQRKLGLKTVALLTAYAIRHGLVDPEVLLNRSARQVC